MPYPGGVKRPPIEEANTIFPCFFCWIHFLMKPCVKASGACTFTSKFLRTRSTGISLTGPASPTPALLNSTSMSHVCAYATSWGSSRSSFSTRRFFNPSSSTLRRSAATCGEICAVAMTMWPFLAMPIAAPSPNPEPAPVMRMVLDMRLLRVWGLCVNARERVRSGARNLHVLRDGTTRHAYGTKRFAVGALERNTPSEGRQAVVREFKPGRGRARFAVLPDGLAGGLEQRRGACLL